MRSPLPVNFFECVAFLEKFLENGSHPFAICSEFHTLEFHLVLGDLMVELVFRDVQINGFGLFSCRGFSVTHNSTEFLTKRIKILGSGILVESGMLGLLNDRKFFLNRFQVDGQTTDLIDDFIANVFGVRRTR